MQRISQRTTALVVVVALFLSAGRLLAADSAGDAAAKGQAVLDKTIAYIKSQQKPDGAWHAENQPPAITAMALRAIVNNPKYEGNADYVNKGYQKLLTYQWETGGIYKDLLANYNTAIAISSLAAANKPDYKPAIDKAVAYLKSLQWTDTIAGGPKGEKGITPDNVWYGGSGYGRAGRPDGSNTSMMMDALHDAGLPKDDPAFKAAAKFVTRMQNLSETNDQKWAGNDGGAIYTPANGGESMAGEYTGPDGRKMFRSYGSMTYAMLKSYIYCGLSKDDPRVKAGWEWVSKNWSLDENPGLRANDPAMAQGGMFYYYHTLARALHAYGQPIITDSQGKQHDWRVELIDKLASIQKPDGSFIGGKRWMEDNPVIVSSFAAEALEETLADLKEHPAK